MKKLTTILVAGFLAVSATAEAGSKCNGTAVAKSQTSRTHVLTSAPAHAAAEKDIVDTAVGAGCFKTLVAAVKAAGLVDTLKGKGPFTVFAPTDEAFAKLPKGTVETLLKPENKAKLQAILTYHVVSGKVMAADVKNSNAKTVNGANVALAKAGDFVTVESAAVVTANLVATNGVIHTVDTVLMPPKK